MAANDIGVVPIADGDRLVGIVTDRDDPDGMGRIAVSFPWLDAEMKSTWAPIAAPMSGGGRDRARVE